MLKTLLGPTFFDETKSRFYLWLIKFIAQSQLLISEFSETLYVDKIKTFNYSVHIN